MKVEVLVVDDGSGPDYAAVFSECARAGARVVHHTHNRGKGAALRTGFADIVARLLAQKLSEGWGNLGVIVDNKPGAGGLIAATEAARAAHHQARQRKPSAKERKVQEAAQQASQSVREVYRKLASSLHPDREPDPAERVRKTALMQRANQAYADNKLLDLLQLQLEAEHIDAAHLARVSEERLQHYNRVLTSQYQELQVEVQSLRAHLQAQLPQHVRLSSKPAGLAKIISTNVQHLRQDGLHLQRTMRALDEDPQLLKAWLKEQRRLFKEQESDFF